MADPKHSRSDAEKGEQKARERDPHGTETGTEAAEHSPQAMPTSDRHKTETADGDGAGTKKGA